MFKALRQVVIILFGTILFVSTVGFSVNKHHCNTKKKTSYSLHLISGDHSKCCKKKIAKEEKKCCKKTKTVKSTTCSQTQLKIKCCDNNDEFLILDLDYEPSPKVVVSSLFLSSNIFFFSNVRTPLIEGVDKKSIKYFNFSPPLIVQNTVVLVQSFLL